MAAYLIANVDVKDAVGYERYRQLVPPTIEKYGGKYLARGGRAEQLEGQWGPKRVVVLEFESVEQAKRWYASEEYREAKAIRVKTAATDVIVVEGV
jgi:uncharacterized protein (DUF1330 family)